MSKNQAIDKHMKWGTSPVIIGTFLYLLLLLTSCSGPRGYTGPQGVPGEQGVPGDPGQPCSVTRISNGVLLECADSSEIIMDGIDGINPVIEVIDPCGDGPGFDELLLRTQVGTDPGTILIAFFEDGKGHRFLTEVTPGSYRTTDQQQCRFTVDNDGGVSW
jgi:hypothetical protein